MGIILKPYGAQDPYAAIELIAHTSVDSATFDTDQMPVLSARVSHAGSGKTGEDPEGDKKLMRYLAKHKHMTPFEHQSATFRVVAPLFVFREWHRHRTQSYNEMSMRYTSDPVGKFWIPERFRAQATRNKQAGAEALPEDIQTQAAQIMQHSYDVALKSYGKLTEIGVCREQARGVVPVGNYSEMYATANLRNWYGFWLLRHDPTAQKEIREYADAIDFLLSGIWPESWKALKEVA
jgi:thymidylate synthase (FAD)